MDSPRGVTERLKHLTMEVRHVRPGARIVLSAILPRFARRAGVMDRFNSEVRQILRDIYIYIYWLTVMHCAMHGTCHVQLTRKGRVGREVRSWPTCRGTVPAFA